jgi:hypothetical protein|nr:MAG TPA_asm: hypothetical protein [Caudoviricetes sp.]
MPYMNPYQQFQTGYQPQGLQTMQSQGFSQSPTANSGINWVSGEVGAKSYLVAPNSTVLLMDSDATRFYLKSADNSGMPSLRIFEYKEVSNAPQNALQSSNTAEINLDSKYVTRDEYDGLKRQYEAIIDRLNGMADSTNKSKSRRGGTGNEQSDI